MRNKYSGLRIDTSLYIQRNANFKSDEKQKLYKIKNNFYKYKMWKMSFLD